jgi:hypothetical protein
MTHYFQAFIAQREFGDSVVRFENPTVGKTENKKHRTTNIERRTLNVGEGILRLKAALTYLMYRADLADA